MARTLRGAHPASSDPSLPLVVPSTTAGSRQLVVPPGFRLYVQARLVCTVQVTGADGEPASQSTEASANSDLVSVTPRLLGFVVMASRVCGRPDISAARMRRVPQARSYGYVAYVLRFATEDARALLGKRLQSRGAVAGAAMPGARRLPGSSDLARIRQSARGAGLDVSAAPYRNMFSRGRLTGVLLRPRRAGKVRLSAAIDGARTNALSVPGAWRLPWRLPRRPWARAAVRRLNTAEGADRGG